MEERRHRCSVCSIDFPTSAKLKNHTYDTHVNKLQVIFPDETLLVEKIDGKFNCPRCPSELSTPTTFNRHLKQHEGHSTTTLNSTQKRKRVVDDDDSSSVVLGPRKCCNLAEHFEEETGIAEHDISILNASDAINKDKSDQEKCIMLSKIGNWKPVFIIAENGEQYHFLTSSKTIGRLLKDQPNGVWKLPSSNNNVGS